MTKAEQGDREERQYDLSDAAATLNRKIENHWKQLRYEVGFSGGRASVRMTFVRGLNDKTLIRLEERSRGFQWFFFVRSHADARDQRHAKGLRDSLGRAGLAPSSGRSSRSPRALGIIRRGNTLIYSTHLPFAIEPNVPDAHTDYWRDGRQAQS